MESELSQGRSPRYPRYSLTAAIGYAKRLYDGAHRSPTDTLTAYKVMGFAGKSGASATALGAARQFGLVETVKGGVRVSDLALQILEPGSQEERVHALHVAANHPSIFSSILERFTEIPRSDEPIRSFLIRSLNFSKSGADDCIASFRETMAELPDFQDSTLPEIDDQPGNLEPLPPEINRNSVTQTPVPSIVPSDGTTRIPLTRDCTVDLTFSGPVTVVVLDRLIRHVELMKEVWAE